MFVKDGRLRVNEQLMEVNNVSLSGMDNSQEIQRLREVIMTDGRIHGFIGITVLRLSAARDVAKSASRELCASQADNSEDAIDGVVPTLARADPVERLQNDSKSGSLPSDAAQVPHDQWISSLNSV